MECTRVQKGLSAYRDGEGSPQQRWRIRGHLSSCARCRAELARLEAVCELLDDVPEPPPLAPDFTGRVVDAARREHAEHSRAADRRGIVHRGIVQQVAAAAAIIVFGVGGGLLLSDPLWGDEAAGDHSLDEVYALCEAPPGSLPDAYLRIDDPEM